jgi:adenylyltransferase/sulfurtransferase
MLSNKELERYSRHIIMPEIGTEGQENLKNAKVLVIGAGGLGSPLLLYLTAAGIGNIGIVEFDKVSISNLQRQILYSTEDLGKSKAEIAFKKLSKINPFVNFKIYNERLNKENVMDIFKDWQIIADCSDNFPTRFLVSDASVILNKILVFGAIFKFEGQVSVFNYKGGPTYRCLFPEQPQENEIPSCLTIGVIGVIPGIIGTMMAGEVIKIILGKGDVLSGTLVQFDALKFEMNKIKFTRNEKYANVSELGEYEILCETNINIKNLLPEELQNLISDEKEYKIFDLRDVHLFNNYNIGGENIDVEILMENPNLIPNNLDVILVCEFGQKSEALAEYLQEKVNFSNIYNLKGGINAWIEAGFGF